MTSKQSANGWKWFEFNGLPRGSGASECCSERGSVCMCLFFIQGMAEMHISEKSWGYGKQRISLEMYEWSVFSCWQRLKAMFHRLAWITTVKKSRTVMLGCSHLFTIRSSHWCRYLFDAKGQLLLIYLSISMSIFIFVSLCMYTGWKNTLQNLCILCMHCVHCIPGILSMCVCYINRCYIK